MPMYSKHYFQWQILEGEPLDPNAISIIQWKCVANISFIRIILRDLITPSDMFVGWVLDEHVNDLIARSEWLDLESLTVMLMC